MQLTQEQQEILAGSRGETMAKVMETLVRYGELYHADAMIPVTGKYNHLVTSFGLKALTPVYELMDQLIAEGAVSGVKFSADPRPLDKNVPSSFLQNLIFKHFMYSRQDFYEGQLQSLGLMDKDAFTCTCYMEEVGNTPRPGDVLSWSESSAVVYANSVLAARCNRNSGIIDLMGAVCGFVPRFGLLTDEGRKAKWIVDIRTTKRPEAQLLGSAIGMKVMEDVPYIRGLDRWLGTLDEDARAYLKDMGAAAASNGAVSLYHVVVIPTVFTAAPAVIRRFNETPYAERLRRTGVIVSYICPLMYMNNPLSERMPVITSSNKLRTYTSARYYTDDENLAQITKGGDRA